MYYDGKNVQNLVAAAKLLNANDYSPNLQKESTSWREEAQSDCNCLQNGTRRRRIINLSVHHVNAEPRTQTVRSAGAGPIEVLESTTNVYAHTLHSGRSGREFDIQG